MVRDASSVRTEIVRGVSRVRAETLRDVSRVRAEMVRDVSSVRATRIAIRPSIQKSIRGRFIEISGTEYNG